MQGNRRTAHSEEIVGRNGQPDRLPKRQEEEGCTNVAWSHSYDDGKGIEELDVDNSKPREKGANSFGDPMLEPMLALKNGCRKAWGVVFEEYRPLVERECFRRLRNASDAEDATQIFAELLWLWKDKFDPSRGRPTDWSFCLARTAAWNVARKKIARSKHEVKLDEMPSGKVEENFPLTLEFDNAINKFREHGRVTEAEWESVKLRLDGLNEAEAADKLGIPIGTHSSRASRFMKRFRVFYTSNSPPNGEAQCEVRSNKQLEESSNDAKILKEAK